MIKHPYAKRGMKQAGSTSNLLRRRDNARNFTLCIQTRMLGCVCNIPNNIEFLAFSYQLFVKFFQAIFIIFFVTALVTFGNPVVSHVVKHDCSEATSTEI
ncbi:hypothetical protein PHAMO_290119 [Magnetospirillum molischianum DSM 120]|uniref:Uncharacterized protein n=1 Tax=Magnetospirillum molischianum DSM 120 TaxID=1150626 RepID=H8FTX4_MAGML|nr:hypothetical protein PHAMO_290119 [Magnetospirillum molischianum DSM 120]